MSTSHCANTAARLPFLAKLPPCGMPLAVAASRLACFLHDSLPLKSHKQPRRTQNSLGLVPILKFCSRPIHGYRKCSPYAGPLQGAAGCY